MVVIKFQRPYLQTHKSTDFQAEVIMKCVTLRERQRCEKERTGEEEVILFLKVLNPQLVTFDKVQT